MEQVSEVLKAIGLSPTLGPSAIAIAILIRMARARLTWFTWSWGYGVAMVLSALMAFVRSAELESPVESGLILLACVLVLQGVLQGLAGVVPWLPRDNDWAAKPSVTSGGNT